MSVNKVILLGNLGQDPELRNTAGGQSVANFSLATNERWKDKDGEKQERTEWHRVVLWGKVAEIAGEYLSKGDTVYVEGKLQTRKWTDKEGNDRYSTEVVGQTLQFVTTKGKGGGDDREQERPAARTSKPAASKPLPKDEDFDDDIPF